MKNLKISFVLMLFSILIVSTGMDIIGDIFEAGLWVGVILVVLVIVLVIWLIRKFF